jgi:hypothetical protein
MNPVIALLLSLFAALGGIWGWRVATKSLHRRSLYSERPGWMSVGEFEKTVVVRLKWWRLLWTALYAVAGAMVGFALLLMIATR